MILLSVIIATCNRCTDLAQCLESFFSQDMPEACSFEMIVADNNSSDRTKDVVQDFAKKYPQTDVRYIFEGRQGKSYALNTAIAGVKGDIVVFTDDDVIFAKDWLCQISEFIQSYNNFDAAGGRILPRFPSRTPVWAKDNIDLISGPVVSYDYGADIKGYDQKQMNPLVGANMIVKRRLLEELGGFNTKLGPGVGTFGDDTELCLRWEKENKRLYYVGTAVVWHPAVKERMTLGYVARWNISSGKYYVVIDKGKIGQGIVCWAGVPRYLFRRMLVNAAKLLLCSFNKRRFLMHWIILFREIGVARAYRAHYLHSSRKINR